MLLYYLYCVLLSKFKLSWGGGGEVLLVILFTKIYVRSNIGTQCQICCLMINKKNKK